MKKLTQEYLKECFTYNPETGIFIWLERPVHHSENTKYKTAQQNSNRRNAVKLDKIAGFFDKDGYIQIKINGKCYRAHRLAFLYMEGYMPENEIDHIDRDKANNIWSNLREVSSRCNAQNCNISKNNKSGVTGVCLFKRDDKWNAYIMIDGKKKHLGYYEDFEDAVKARYNEEQNNPEWSCSVESSALKYLKENNLI